MLLAAEAPPADFTHNALLLAVIVVQLVSTVLAMNGRREAQRRQVSFETEFATRDEMKSLTADVKSVEQDLAELKESIVENGDKRRIAIETKLDTRCSTIEHKIEGLQTTVSAVAVAVARLEK